MSWDDQVAAEESRGLASGVVSTPQAPLSTSLMPHGSNHGTAESGSQLGSGSAEPGTCDVTYPSLVTVTYPSLVTVTYPSLVTVTTYITCHSL